jgi:hypothetical protein
MSPASLLPRIAMLARLLGTWKKLLSSLIRIDLGPRYLAHGYAGVREVAFDLPHGVLTVVEDRRT